MGRRYTQIFDATSSGIIGIASSSLGLSQIFYNEYVLLSVVRKEHLKHLQEKSVWTRSSFSPGQLHC